MTAYIVRRLAQSIAVVVGLAVVVFFVTRLLGDAARLMLPLNATEEQYIALRAQLGLDDPLYEQFGRYLAQILRGDFGTSLWQNVPAMDLVISRLPATAYLALATMLFSLVIAIPMGIVAAIRPGSFVDRLTTLLSILGLSLPTFWIALLLIAFVAVGLGWFKTSGYGGLDYVVLPVLALSMQSIGRLVQVVRSSMLDVLSMPYLTTARSKGLTETTTLSRHALRNAAIPMVTIAADETATLLNGAVVIEVIFGWPGIGKLALDAIERRDFPLIQACVLFVAAMVVTLNLLVDLVYARLDPRITYR